MKKPKLSDMLGIINKLAPFSLAESWDNVGLQVGDPTAEISQVMIALDATPAVVEEAIANNCQLLVTHHPLIFKPQKSISTATAQGKLIHDAIRGGLAIVSIHTNYDIVENGLNDILAQRLELRDCTVLQVTSRQELAKLVVFVPESHLEQVRSALFPHAESLGAYRDCSFGTSGEGTFTPLMGAAPFIGTVGTLETVREFRLEILIDTAKRSQILKTLLAVHPYEEPAFDLYPLQNEGEKRGLGRVGHLSESTTLADYAEHVAAQLQTTGVRFVGDPAAKVSKVALCSGSGASVLRAAARAGAHALVTGDVKYHDARDAEDLGIALIDAGHFSTEIIMVAAVHEQLQQSLASAGFSECRVRAARSENDPFHYPAQKQNSSITN
jgi:dinuclear metal center YbgI/SA1388 family protein